MANFLSSIEMSNLGQRHRQNLRQVKLRHSMRTKILLAFLFVFLTTFLGTGFIALKGLPFGNFGGWQADAKKEAINRLGLVADLEKERLHRWFGERLADVQLIAENHAVRVITPVLFSSLSTLSSVTNNVGSSPLQMTNEQPYQQIYKFLLAVQAVKEQHRNALYQEIRIVDIASGRIAVSTHPDEVGSIFTLNDRLMDLVVRTRRAYISDVVSESGGIPPHFDVGHPVFDMEGMLIGVVVMEIAMGKVLNLYSYGNRAGSDTEEALLVDENLRVLTSLRHPSVDGRQDEVLGRTISAKPARLAAMGHEGIIESEDYRGEKVIAAYRHIRVSPDWGWGLVVKVDSAQLFASINTATRYSYWFAATGSILIVLLSLLMAHRLIKPLSKISAAAMDLASGNRFQQIQIDRHDEIGVLATAFNTMVEKLDLTNRHLKQRSAEVDAVNKELESFAYSIAHDLRAPLRAINGFSDVLMEGHSAQLDDEAKKYLKYVQEGSQEMGHLIDGLLRLSRVTRGEMVYEDVDLSSMVADIMARLKLADPDRLVDIDIAPGAVVSGDSRLLRVALENLLDNAWKFTGARSDAHIRFTVEHVNGRIRCSVQDNGAGFDMAYENKLFLPFQRLHRAEEFEGNGIGLVTVQRIIHRHGGTIKATGVVGNGASFIFELDAGRKDYG